MSFLLAGWSAPLVAKAAAAADEEGLGVETSTEPALGGAEESDASESRLEVTEDEAPPPLYEVRRRDRDAGGAGDAKSGGSSFDPADLPPPHRAQQSAPEEELDVRFAGLAGFHLNFGDTALAGYGNGFGGGFHFAALAAPPSWPVLFGVQMGIETYGGPRRGGRHFVLTSYSVLAAARLQPDEWSVRPRLDLVGGLWGLDVGVPSGNQPAIINAGETVGGRATWVVGAGVGVDFIWQRYRDYDYGVGFGVQVWKGGYMKLPDPYGFGERERDEIRAVLFLIDFVAFSRSPQRER